MLLIGESSDFFFQNKINIWDIAAGALMIKEAGGIVNEINKNWITINY